MKITQEQYEKIKKYLPRQCGNVSMSNLHSVNAILDVTENTCKWRALPKNYGNCHRVYVRLNRWSKNGVFPHLFEGLQQLLKTALFPLHMLPLSACIIAKKSGNKKVTDFNKQTQCKVCEIFPSGRLHGENAPGMNGDHESY